jgi:hypothetical protein
MSYLKYQLIPEVVPAASLLVESEVASEEPPLPQAAKAPITNTINNFFIFTNFLFYKYRRVRKGNPPDKIKSFTGGYSIFHRILKLKRYNNLGEANIAIK